MPAKKNKSFKEIKDKAVTEVLSDLELALRSNHTSATLVRGDDIQSALLASLQSFEGSRLTNRDSKSETVWMAAYFGRSSNLPKTIIQNATIKEGRIRISYTEPTYEITVRGALSKPHFFLIPIGNLAPRDYALEFYNLDEKQVTFMRIVKLVKPAE